MRFLPRILLILTVLFHLGSAAALENRDIRIETASGGVTLTAELAVTEGERMRGLMGREDFAPGDAMLFIFPEAKGLSFWMKDTPVSLDIVFFDAMGRWINTAARTVPYSLENHHSRRKGKFALEIAAGEAERLGIGAGSRLVLPVRR